MTADLSSDATLDSESSVARPVSRSRGDSTKQVIDRIDQTLDLIADATSAAIDVKPLDWCSVSVIVPAWAGLSIEITQGADNPTRIAVVPMTPAAGSLPGDISAIVSADLQRSGLFDPMDRVNMLSFPRRINEIYYRDWRTPGMEYVVVGQELTHYAIK